MPGAHKKAENRFDFLPNLIKKLNLDDVEDGDLVNTDNEDLREGVRYYKEIVMWNFGYSNYYINEIKLPEEEQR